MDLDSFASRLTKSRPFKTKGQRGYRAMCPAHKDDNPSFAVWEGMDGYLHVKCQAGCSEDEVLMALGMSQSDRKMEQSEGINESCHKRETYLYRGKKGQYLLEKIRFYRESGKKGFVIQVREKDGVQLTQISTTDKPDLHWPSPEECGLGDKVFCLYNLPEVLEAARTGRKVYFCNGEKAADQVMLRGEVGTCLLQGENAPWKPWYNEHLRGAEVILVGQRDKPGIEWCKRISAELIRAVINCTIVNSMTDGEKDDAYDHLVFGYTFAQLVNRSDLLPDEDIRGFVWANEVEPKEVDWLFKPYFALGTVCGIEGDPGIGKSLLGAAMACVVSNGAAIPAFQPEPGISAMNALLYATEDAKEYVTVPRLIALGGELGKIALIDHVVPFNDAGLDDLEMKIRATNARMVIIDPITAFIEAASGVPGSKINVHMIMDRLKAIAASTHSCIICLRHLNKSSKADDNPVYAGLGSIAIVGKYRSCIQVRWDRERKGICVVTHIKTNMGEKGKGFSYRIFKRLDGLPQFEWFEPEIEEGYEPEYGPEEENWEL